VVKKVLWKNCKDILKKVAKVERTARKILEKNKKILNILPLQSRSLETSPPFSSPIFFSFLHKSFPISKFERTCEEIRKNERDYKETLNRYNFRKPRRLVGLNKQVDPISISNSKEDHQKDDLQ
jgi:hypothetical protein